MSTTPTYTCPPWCTTHHRRHGPFTEQMRGAVRHEPDEAVIVLDVTPGLGIRELAAVVAVRQDYADRGPADHAVELELDSPMSPADARKVADVLLWAANLVDPPGEQNGSPAAGESDVSPREFPVGQRIENDPRFTSALAYDVARVLAAHGYPMPASGADLEALQRLLAGFLYGDGAA